MIAAQGPSWLARRRQAELGPDPLDNSVLPHFGGRDPA